MVFSLFRRKSRAGASTGSDDRPEDSTLAVHSGPGASTVTLSDRELGRLTAEKIDQIESEMISDALAAGVDELEAHAMGLPSAVAAPQRKPTAVELLGQLTVKEARREAGLHDAPDPAVDWRAMPAVEAPRHAAPEKPAPSRAAQRAAEAAEADALAPTSTLIGEDPLAIEIVDGAMPVGLEESAILFSNGNFDGAREALERAMGEPGLSAGYRTLAWHMMFDLLRVMGDRDAFEQLAIAYAGETESSPPAWNEDLKAPALNRKRPSSPSQLVLRGTIDSRTASVVEQLQRAAGHRRDCGIDLREADDVDAEGAAHLLRLFDVFMAGDWPLRVLGARRLLDLAQAHIETGRRDEQDVFWRLALMALRLQGQEQRFDDLSIDFCVTYEVSPPAWAPVPATLVVESGEAPGVEEDAVATTIMRASGTQHPDRLKVKGELIGKVDTLAAAIDDLAASFEVVSLECQLLRRVDFTAAGALLNLLIQLQGRARRLVFLQPNYMVYALMLVMGMQEVAGIRRRRV